MAWQAIAGALGGSGMDFGLDIAKAKYQFKQQRKLAKHAVSWRVQDLQRAGLNPILAAGGMSAGVGSAPSQAPVRTNLQDALRTSSLRKLQEGQLDAARASAEYNRAAARRQDQEAGLARALRNKAEVQTLPYEVVNNYLRGSSDGSPGWLEGFRTNAKQLAKDVLEIINPGTPEEREERVMKRRRQQGAFGQTIDPNRR